MGALFDWGIDVQCVKGEHIWVGRGGWAWGCTGLGAYQPRVCVPLKALFLVLPDLVNVPWRDIKTF